MTPNRSPLVYVGFVLVVGIGVASISYAGQQPPPNASIPVTVINTEKNPLPVCDACDRATRAFSNTIRDDSPCAAGGILAEVPPGFRLVVEYVSARSVNPVLPVDTLVLRDSENKAFAAISGVERRTGGRHTWTFSERLTLYVNGGETLRASFPFGGPVACGPGFRESELVIGVSGYLVRIP